MNTNLSQSVKEYALVSDKNGKHKKEKKYFSRPRFYCWESPIVLSNRNIKGPKKNYFKIKLTRHK